VTERQKIITRERGREEPKDVKYEPIACKLYPIAAGTYERRWHFGVLLRVKHPVRSKSYSYHQYASRILVFAVIIAVAVVLFVVIECSRVTQQRWSSSAGTSSDSFYPVHGSSFTDR